MFANYIHITGNVDINIMTFLNIYADLDYYNTDSADSYVRTYRRVVRYNNIMCSLRESSVYTRFGRVCMHMQYTRILSCTCTHNIK